MSTLVKVWVAVAAVAGPLRKKSPPSYLLNLHQDVTQTKMEFARQAAVSRFKAYIPENASGFRTTARVSHSLPTDRAAEFFPNNNTIEFQPYLPYRAVTEITVHEFVHAFASKSYMQAVVRSHHPMELSEALTNHLTLKVLVNEPGFLSEYLPKTTTFFDRPMFSSGMTLTQWAQRLEDSVGEEAILKAYFSGDRIAIHQVFNAAYSLIAGDAIIDPIQLS